jgi:glutamate--cysteine ligase catalytic subunit
MKSIILLAVIIFGVLPVWKAAILRRGNPLAFNQAKQFFSSVRKSGVTQFASHYTRVKDVKTAKFLWGDELEYGIFAFNEDTKTYDIATCRGVDIQTELDQLESKLSGLSYGSLWQPEYGSWMVETVPRGPYDGFASTLLSVERSMQLRRKRLHSALRPNEIAPSLTAFPMLGVRATGLCGECNANSTTSVSTNSSSQTSAVAAHEAALQSNNSVSLSCYIRDDAINPHPRFTTLTKNIRMRRGRKVDIKIPKEDSSGMIHMDAMAFGMGCCCLQITMQSSSDRESRFLHDQLAILSPFFLALSAATPILKGQLAGTDTRWETISQAVDDRTAVESGEVELSSGVAVPDPDLAGNGVKRLYKSRYSSVSRYIGKAASSEEAQDLERMNDIDANIDEDLYKYISSFPDIDESLAKHIAHLFTRDPLVIFDDAIALDDQRALVSLGYSYSLSSQTHAHS